MLKIIPDLKFPLTGVSINPLMDMIVQFNTLDGAVTEPQQRALGLYLHTYDLWCKSGGRIDYRGRAGHERLKSDAARFATLSVVTRSGDLPAAHLSIDFSDTQIRLTAAKMPLLPTNVSDLLGGCMDLCGLSVQEEKRIGLLMDVLGKRPVI